MPITPIQEDYLEIIFGLALESGAGVRTTDIAERLGCKLPTVTRTIRKMVQAGFVEHETRGLIRLTQSGRRAAQDLAHRHADTVTFLVGVLGLTREEAEVDACQVEHGLSPLAAQRLHEFLEHVQSLDENQRDVITRFARKRSIKVTDFAHLPAGRTAGWRG
jgi:DtxR family Mn-dependent transcriptional regulator